VAVTGIAGVIGDGFALAMAKMVGHLGFQRPLHHHLGQLLKQAINTADQLFRGLVLG
jgi:hypothetical protein